MQLCHSKTKIYNKNDIGGLIIQNFYVRPESIYVHSILLSKYNNRFALSLSSGSLFLERSVVEDVKTTANLLQMPSVMESIQTADCSKYERYFSIWNQYFALT